jgi:hypothetical protein
VISPFSEITTTAFADPLQAVGAAGDFVNSHGTMIPLLNPY